MVRLPHCGSGGDHLVVARSHDVCAALAGERILAAPCATVLQLEEMFCGVAWRGELGILIGNGGVLDGRLLCW